MRRRTATPEALPTERATAWFEVPIQDVQHAGEYLTDLALRLTRSPGVVCGVGDVTPGRKTSEMWMTDTTALAFEIDCPAGELEGARDALESLLAWDAFAARTPSLVRWCWVVREVFGGLRYHEYEFRPLPAQQS